MQIRAPIGQTRGGDARTAYSDAQFGREPRLHKMLASALPRSRVAPSKSSQALLIRSLTVPLKG